MSILSKDDFDYEYDRFSTAYEMSSQEVIDKVLLDKWENELGYINSSRRKVIKVWHTPHVQELIGYIARVSNPNNQLNFDTAPKLLKYCIKNNHWSVFEQGELCIRIVTSRAIAAQMLRHRTAQAQEFCITGDSLITTEVGNRKPNYIPIERLYKNQKTKKYANLKIRVFDELTQEFTTAPLKEVFYTGKKPVYKITLSDGKVIS